MFRSAISTLTDSTRMTNECCLSMSKQVLFVVTSSIVYFILLSLFHSKTFVCIARRWNIVIMSLMYNEKWLFVTLSGVISKKKCSLFLISVELLSYLCLALQLNPYNNPMARSHGLVVKTEDSWPRVVSSRPGRHKNTRWMLYFTRHKPPDPWMTCSA